MVSSLILGMRKVTCSFNSALHHHAVVVSNILADVPEPYKEFWEAVITVRCYFIVVCSRYTYFFLHHPTF